MKVSYAEIMIDIKVIGPGCMNCTRLEMLCREVVKENNLDATVEKISDFNEFGRYGIMLTPGLVVNGKVLVQEKIPVKHTLVSWLLKTANEK